MAGRPALALKPPGAVRWDLVALGEVMLRLDPGESRIAAARSFAVWEGGGEYNVARGLASVFHQRTAVVTALVDNPVGRLVQSLIRAGGVDDSLIRWVEHDGAGRRARNGLNFTERGYGPRAPLGCSDRGHTAVSQLRAADIDWDAIFGQGGARVLHTGGIFCALAPGTPAVARAAMDAARRHGVLVSYDLNYRESLWRDSGGRAAADAVNRELLPHVDVLFGAPAGDEPGAALTRLATEFPNLRAIATPLRRERSASAHGWGGAALLDGECIELPSQDIAVLDRVGGGDAFAAGFLLGLLEGRGARWALECALAHGALAMSTPGDNSMARRTEVEAAMRGAGAAVRR